MRKALLLAAAIGATSAGAQTTAPVAPGFDVAAAKAQIDANLDKTYPDLEAVYKDIHAHPEVGFQETRTAALLADRMRKLGFTVTEHVGKTGIVAIYRNGAGPTVLVRTELDALPMQEKTGLPYASTAQQTVNGKLTYVAHSCGHDSHMAWWLGTAETLLAMKKQWHGTLMFIGQPAEEGGGGAKAMLDDGLFTRFPKPDYGFAAHVGAAAFGTMVVKQGVASSTADAISITFHGVGAHGSMPDKAIDPIMQAVHFVDDVQAVVSRQKSPLEFGVVSVGSFQAGSVSNIIPDRADLQLTLRSFDPAVRKLLLDGVTTTANAAAMMAHAPAPDVIRKAGSASVVNDEALSAQAAAVMRTAFGATNVDLQPSYKPGSSASEDYSDFVGAGMPKSIFFFIGGDDPGMLARYKAEGKPVPVNHSPLFAPVPEPTIRTGVATLTLAVLMVASGR